MIRHLPVTTEVALRGGADFDNFPKFIAQIDFTQTDEEWRCRVAEGEEHILTLSGKRISAPRSRRVDLFSHLWMDGQPQTAQFTVNQFEVGSAWCRDAAVLELAEHHPVVAELRKLLVSLKPLQYEYDPRFEGSCSDPSTPRCRRSSEDWQRPRRCASRSPASGSRFDPLDDPVSRLGGASASCSATRPVAPDRLLGLDDDPCDDGDADDFEPRAGIDRSGAK